ncbi:hypothetical protein, conserved [Leishmania donovani]|uniref:Uncharacterized protein n=1 Tax=Leishmania donovani TaxID=5661 RepID=A0A3Q8IGT5_LEIDO|nr:hypothetical protein, conserved [Leishmania donovani]AYU84035.1 hypothetical protein LdCL_360075500 [Leishmania donovani]TPP48783.1 hypothetical protein CGC21_15665 [Leishmania donovani]CBZ39107.1 hypothetical protein, conserved [Leishmania donovani]
MNREQIARRIDLVGPSTGAIVGVATWCALHGAEADAILNYVAEKMKHKDTTDAQRASLVYVIHELLLSCATRGVSENAKRSILKAVSLTLPSAVKDTLRQRASDHTAFLIALQKATEWWSMLNLFPAAWLTKLQCTVQDGQESAGHRTSVPSALMQVANLLQRYQHAKEQWVQNRNIKAEEGRSGSGAASGQDTAAPLAGGGAGASSAVVDDAARRCLIALRKAVESRFEKNAALLAWCEAERAELEGRTTTSSAGSGVVKMAHGTSPHVPTHGRSGSSYPVKEEGGHGGSQSGGPNDDDDVLGSFFS